MSQSKDMQTFSPVLSPSFIADLLPAAERTALLFQLSYLYLAGFTELEKMIRERALSARLLFVSSEKVMFKCLCTSDNLVKTLFPILKVAVQKCRVDMAKTYLAKAQDWITEIIEDAQKMVDGYTNENKELSNSTSTIYEKKEEKRVLNEKMKAVDDQLKQFKSQLQTIDSQIASKQQQVNGASGRVDQQISHMASCDKRFAARTTFCFGFISWTCGPSDAEIAATRNSNRDTLNQLHQVLQGHMQEVRNLRQREQQVQTNLMAKKMELVDLELKDGSIPSPEHLEEVKYCLVRIQSVLVQILRFWNHVSEILKKLEQQTFAGTDLLEDLEFFKEIYLYSICEAEKAWRAFGQSCMKSKEIFDFQSKEAYRFLETNPASMSDAQKQQQIFEVNHRLKELYQKPIEDSNSVTY
ncbi:uncharacterized protein LOC134468758 [Engraulis encrasicolus]|uniref:uncharacterized protein LOC134468758 n=1 Tax=Engraulis encrasicolus TaxID=184585 RepID=UPI002FD2D86D